MTERTYVHERVDGKYVVSRSETAHVVDRVTVDDTQIKGSHYFDPEKLTFSGSTAMIMTEDS